MQQWWWALVPIALAAVGYAIRRRIEGRRRSEGLKRKLQALALHNGIRQVGLTIADLERIERKASK